MIVPEPDNPKSEGALAVRTIDGSMLGYVPGYMSGQDELKARVQFGTVVSRGPARERPEMHGVRVCFSYLNCPPPYFDERVSSRQAGSHRETKAGQDKRMMEGQIAACSSHPECSVCLIVMLYDHRALAAGLLIS